MSVPRKLVITQVEEEEIEEVEEDDADALYFYGPRIEEPEEEACDCCMRGWGRANEYGICRCVCSNCGDDYALCKATCYNCNQQ